MVRTSLGAEFTANVDVRGAEDVVTVTADSSTSLPAGTAETKIISPPDGFVYELLCFRFLVPGPSGATSGNHLILLQPESAFITALFVESSHTDFVEVSGNTIQTGTAKQVPTTEAAQTESLKGLRASPTTGYKVTYRNLTDSSQSDDRQIRFWLRRVEVERQ